MTVFLGLITMHSTQHNCRRDIENFGSKRL